MEELHPGSDASSEREFYARLNGLPEEQKNIISALSNHFLEPDIYQKFVDNPAKLSALRRMLLNKGFNQEGINIAMQAFHLGDTKVPPPTTLPLP